MILIAHRGNTHGGTFGWENTVDHIESALSDGYEVEVDVWLADDDLLYLGHDGPEDILPIDLLEDRRIWFHAKDIDTLAKVKDVDLCNYFFHQNDDVTLTNDGYLWTFPGCQLTKHSIAVVKDIDDLQWVCLHLDSGKSLAGICSDFVGEEWFKRAINE